MTCKLARDGYTVWTSALEALFISFNSKNNMSVKRKIIPLGDRVLVRTLEAITKTKSGIIIPDSVNKERPEQGTVMAVGKGRTTDEGVIIKPAVNVGDEIIFSKYGPDEITIDGEKYFILSESNILAIIN